MKKVIFFKDNILYILDQRKLPEKEEYIEIKNYKEASAAIKNMAVRGAPVIGITAAYGYYLGFIENAGLTRMKKVKKTLLETRPTAVDLAWALEKMEKAPATKILKLKAADEIMSSRLKADKKISAYGAELLKKLASEKRISVLTHCNAGALATGGVGTALGVIKKAYKDGTIKMVYAGETRPKLQGAALTCYELKLEKISYNLICDTMPGFLMKRKKIDAVIVGADRIAANGDTANKIGTYQLAILAKFHSIPFYVAAPLSTFDFSISSSESIPIETRDSKEVLFIQGKSIAPTKTKVKNPAFDVTPHNLINSFITEKGVIGKPDELQ